MKSVEDYVYLESGVRIFYRCVAPENHDILVVILHGYTAHSGMYIHMARELAGYGYAVCLYDQRGHGRTAQGGDRGYVDSFEDYLKDLEQFTIFAQKSYGAKKAVLIGHSMGGLVALLYTAKYGRVGDAVVGIAPAVLIPVSVGARLVVGLLSVLSPRKRIKLPFTREQVEALTKKLDKDLVDTIARDDLALRDTTARLLSEIWRAASEYWKYVNRVDKPVMLIHGNEDNIIPVEASKRTYREIGSRIKELKIYPGKGHTLIHEVGWRDVVKDISEWIEKIL